MGFRSTLAAQDWNIAWPRWFREKYSQLLRADESGTHNTLCQDFEVDTWVYSDLPADLQRALTEVGFLDDKDDVFVYVWLHECGGITRVQVMKDDIAITYPTAWSRHDGPGQDSVHSDGCAMSCSHWPPQQPVTPTR